MVLEVLRVGPDALHLDHLRLPELPHRLVRGVLVDDATSRGDGGSDGGGGGGARRVVVVVELLLLLLLVLRRRCGCCRGLSGSVRVGSRGEHGEGVLLVFRKREREKGIREEGERSRCRREKRETPPPPTTTKFFGLVDICSPRFEHHRGPPLLRF